MVRNILKIKSLNLDCKNFFFFMLLNKLFYDDLPEIVFVYIYDTLIHFENLLAYFCFTIIHTWLFFHIFFLEISFK
jgi:hypothetical protein